MDSILNFFSHPAITAIIGFLSGIFGQFLLRNQISKHEIKKVKIEYRNAQLEKLKQCAEQLINQIMAYDDFANHIVITIKHGLHDEKKLFELEQKIKKIKDDLSPKLQIYFHDLASCQNDYSKAVAAFQRSFFRGIEYVNIKQRGWTKEDIDRMNEELSELSLQKYKLIAETLKYLNKKEESMYEN